MMQDELDGILSLQVGDFLAFNNLSAEMYHELPGLSSTMLTTIADQSILHLKREKSSSFEFGNFIHTAILEADQLESRYMFTDEKAPPRSTKEGKEAEKAFLEETGKTKEEIKDPDEWKRAYFSWKNPNKIAICSEWENRKNAILSKMKTHPLKKYVEMGVKEQSIFWAEEIDGMKIIMKCKPDINLVNNIIIDLKTTEDASLRGFKRSIMKYNYDWSLAYHARGIEMMTGKKCAGLGWVAVEKEYPHAFNMLQMSAEMREIADNCINATLKKYVHQMRLKQQNMLDHVYGLSWQIVDAEPWQQDKHEKIK